MEVAGGHYLGAIKIGMKLGMKPLVAQAHFALGALYAENRLHTEARAEIATALQLLEQMDAAPLLERMRSAAASLMDA
jgi:hypothetical protein